MDAKKTLNNIEKSRTACQYDPRSAPNKILRHSTSIQNPPWGLLGATRVPPEASGVTPMAKIRTQSQSRTLEIMNLLKHGRQNAGVPCCLWEGFEMKSMGRAHNPRMKPKKIS